MFTTASSETLCIPGAIETRQRHCGGGGTAFDTGRERVDYVGVGGDWRGLEALEALRIQFGQLAVDGRPCMWDAAF